MYLGVDPSDDTSAGGGDPGSSQSSCGGTSGARRSGGAEAAAPLRGALIVAMSRWSEQRVARELENFVACTDEWPSYRDFVRAGHKQLCEQKAVTLILGASNAWFAVQSSALSIPSQAGELAQAVDEAWSILDGIPPGRDFLEFTLKSNAHLKKLQALTESAGIDEVEQAITARRDGLEDGDPGDLRTPEWRVLSTPEQAPETSDFKLRSVGPPAQFADRIADVVLAERLREVSALRGFTRLNAPDDLNARGGSIVRPPRADPTWLPCSEVRGEGVFIRFPEERVLEWEQTYRDSGAAAVLRDAHRGWRARRGLPPDDGWPCERYVLLHSFAHALIRELALECGYTASSIRERIYAASGADADPMAGVLLYTAAPDSEGTLGGLVSLGEPEQFGPLLRQALERAQLCSSDPLCSEHDPRSDNSVHAAACHACQFASETSCERGNRYLDRATISATLVRDDVSYFAAA